MNAKTAKSLRCFARQPRPAQGDKSLPSATSESTDASTAEQLEATGPKWSRPDSKIARITGLLSRTGGASLAELVAPTYWQPHTTRAALTGLRKKGHAIAKAKVGGVTRYTIAAATQA